jgi:ribonuclease BN (tRNA processing enzyme)
MVRVRFLGSGDAFGSGGRFQACIQVSNGSSTALLDCGASSLVALRHFDLQPNDIDCIAVSHLHGDHFGGIPFFVLDAQLVSKRTRPLVVAGPPGIEQRVKGAMEVFFPGSSSVKRNFEIEFMELRDRVASVLPPGKLTGYEVVHASGAPAFALRLETGGRAIAYSGDTEWTDVLCEAAAKADLFICEAYYADKKMKYHLDFETLRSNIGKLSCRRLVTTHMSSDMLARELGEGIEPAEDGMTIDL